MALEIQRRFRGMLGRRRADERRLEAIKERKERAWSRERAILLAQRCARRWLAASRASALRYGYPYPAHI
eukprot:scaffold337985_cov45-Prasinocladus_malaysianus.AAC.1